MNIDNHKKLTTDVVCFINRVSMKEGSKFTSKIENYLTSNGPEWTVNRLKSIYNLSLHLKNQDVSKAIIVCQENSISYTKAGYPKDYLLRTVVKRFVQSKKPSSMKNALMPLRVYTAIKLERPSESQVLKAQTTINSETTVTDTKAIPTSLKLISYALSGKKQRLSIINDDRYLDKLRPFTSTYSHRSPKGIPNEIREKPYFNTVFSMMNESYIPSSLKKLVPAYEIADRNRDLVIKNGGELSKHCGKIHIIQEGGCKGRTVAIPNTWVSLSFRPLHTTLSQFTERKFSDWSCVKDQKRGAKMVESQISKGMKCHSIDLSAATDRFPLELQTHVLDELGLEQYSTALKELCQQTWDFPQGKDFGVDHVTYKTGQPMGLYGSFPLFNLTHIALALGIQRWLEEKKGEDLTKFDDGTCFKIIGDDFVTSSDMLAKYYTKQLTKIGVQVSPLKTISGHVAEFAGFLTVPAKTNTGVVSFRPYKWPKENYITNPIDFLHAVKDNKRMNQKWQARFDTFNKTRNSRHIDLSPIFQDESPTQVGIHGTIGIQDVVSLRDNIIRFDSDGNYLLSRTEWLCNEPIVYDGVSAQTVKSMQRQRHIAPNTERVKEPTVNHTVVTAKRFRNDPLVSEVLAEEKSHAKLIQEEKSSNASMPLQFNHVDSQELNDLNEEIRKSSCSDASAAEVKKEKSTKKRRSQFQRTRT